MTREELYRIAFVENPKDENDANLEHIARTIIEQKFDGITDTREAVILALELLPEMTGQEADPTEDDISDIIYYVENPGYVRIRRALIKIMQNGGSLCDFVLSNYYKFSKEHLARIIAEIDCAVYDADITKDKDDYKEVMCEAAGKIKEWMF